MRWLTMALLVACSGSDDKEGTDDTAATGTDDTNTQTDTDTSDTDPYGTTDTDTTVTGAAGALSGEVVDATGAPVEGVNLKLCRGEVCRTDETTAAGAFDFPVIEADWHSFEVVPPSDDLAVALAPVQVGEGEDRVLTATLVPLDPATSLSGTATEVETGEGLYVTLATDDLEGTTFAPDPTEAAGVRVPAAQQLPVDGASEVIDMWFMHPYNYTPVAGDIPARFDNLWSLPEGNTYEVWVGSYKKSEWLVAGELTVVKGELVGDVMLPVTSTVVLVVP